MKQVGQIVNRQMQEWELRRRVDRSSSGVKGPVVCLSRDIGSGAREVAKNLAGRLDLHILGRDTIDFVSEDLHAQRRLIDILDEKGKESLERWVDGYLHGTPIEYDEYARSLVRVVRSAAMNGSVLFLGRGSSFILGLREAFCVRLVAPLDRRTKRLMAYESIGREQARARIEEADEERRRFIERVFHRDVMDPLAYHLTLNTGELDLEKATEIILCAMRLEGFLESNQPC
jgi:cytidylate kinase